MPWPWTFLGSTFFFSSGIFAGLLTLTSPLPSLSGTETLFYILFSIAIGHHDRHYLIRQVGFLQCPRTPPSYQLWLLWVGPWCLWPRADHTNIQILVLAGTPRMSCKASSGLSHCIKCHFTNLSALPEVKWLFDFHECKKAFQYPFSNMNAHYCQYKSISNYQYKSISNNVEHCTIYLHVYILVGKKACLNLSAVFRWVA